MSEILCDDYGHVWGGVIGEPARNGQRCDCGKVTWPEPKPMTSPPTLRHLAERSRDEISMLEMMMGDDPLEPSRRR